MGICFGAKTSAIVAHTFLVDVSDLDTDLVLNSRSVLGSERVPDMFIVMMFLMNFAFALRFMDSKSSFLS